MGLLMLKPAKELMDQFNRSKNKVRVVTLLSPTCPECLLGFEMVRKLLVKFPSKGVSVFLIWVPMLAEDNFETATARSGESSDSRLMQAWDASGQMGRLFAKTLDLQKMAWDVYLAYAPVNANWREDAIQPPDFWMHQLTLDPGAPSSLRLNEGVFFQRISDLLAKLQMSVS